MRGTESFPSPKAVKSRITPAHAGNSLCSPTRGPSSGDHPRTCGEQSLRKTKSCQITGSPPHMRGTGREGTEMALGNRITPAHAGNSLFASFLLSRIRDHPRTCGEQLGIFDVPGRRSGSPPHMRGTVNELHIENPAERITPAHAGNSPDEHCRISLCEDHPRTCGEQAADPVNTRCHTGSPPHMRGTASVRMNDSNISRITPAHAGNSFFLYHYIKFSKDHPRTCGEQLPDLLQKIAWRGSPPHMRGTDYSDENIQSVQGITPAHAGNR